MFTSHDEAQEEESPSSTTRLRKFTEYRRLADEFRKRDQSWQHWEDLALLRGFAIYGERWPLVQMYHVPHRDRNEVISRWNFLQTGNNGIVRKEFNDSVRSKRHKRRKIMTKGDELKANDIPPSKEAEAFFKENPVPSATMKLSQTLENMRTKIAWLERENAALTSYFT